MLDTRGLGKASDFVNAQDFFLSPNRVIFEAITDLQEENQGIDLVTVGEWLSRNGKLEVAGGYPYLSSVADGLPRATNMEYYARIVKEKSVMRQMIYAAETIQGLAASGEQESLKIAGQAVEMFSSFANWDIGTEKTSRKKAAIKLIQNLSDSQDSNVLLGIQRVDEVLGGFRAEEVEVLTAETGAGKSFLALQIARLACSKGVHGLYCSGEMSAAHLMGRELSGATGVESYKIRRPSRLTNEDYRRLTDAAGKECDTCMILDGELTLPRIRSTVRSMGKGKIGYLIVDYDELVEVHGVKDEWDAQRKLVRAMKSIAIEMQLPAFLISQLRKALDKYERKHPTLDRLYGSGSKMKHASIILYLDRPYVVDLEGEETDATIFILKSRDSKMGRCECTFNIQTLRFEQKEELPPIVSRVRNRGIEEED